MKVALASRFPRSELKEGQKDKLEGRFEIRLSVFPWALTTSRGQVHATFKAIVLRSQEELDARATHCTIRIIMPHDSPDDFGAKISFEITEISQVTPCTKNGQYYSFQKNTCLYGYLYKITSETPVYFDENSTNSTNSTKSVKFHKFRIFSEFQNT